MEDEQPRTPSTFFADFEGLMEIHREHLPDNYKILPTINLGNSYHKIDFTAKDAEVIVNGIKNFDKEQIRRIPFLKRYLRKVLDEFEYRIRDRRNWEYHYPDEDLDVYTIELGMVPVLRNLIHDLSRPVTDFFGIIKPEEIMTVRSISRQKRIPSDVATHVLSEYVGNIPKGGKRSRRKTIKRIRRRRKTMRKT